MTPLEEEKSAEDNAEDEKEETIEPDAEEVEKKESFVELHEKKLVKSIIEKGKTLYLCPYPGCKFKCPKLSGVYGHMSFIHKTKGDYLDPTGNVIKKTPRTFPGNSPFKGANKQRSVPRMGDSEAGGTPPVEPGRKAELKGRLRQLLKVIAMAEQDKRDALIPMREVLMDYIRLLSKVNITEEELTEVSNRLEDQVYPEVEDIIGKDKVAKTAQGITPLSTSSIPKLATVTRISKLRGAAKQYISQIARLPPSKRDDLFGERETLSMLNRRLGAKDIPEEELSEMEDVLETDVRPTVDAALAAASKIPAPKKEPSSDEMGSEIQAKEEELKLTRMDRMLTEEKLRTKQTIDAMRVGGGATSGAMVPLVRPMISETGELKKDKDGKIVMETTYAPVDQAGSMNNMMMTLMLSGKLGGGNDAMAAILPAILDNNTKVLVAMLEKNRGDSGPSTREIILETQNKNLEMMMNMQKANQETMAAIAAKKTDDPAINQMREELRTAREENARTRDDLYKQQLNYLHKEMDDLKSYAYRDDLETMLKQKEKLERLGVVNPTSKDAETKALENSTLLAKEGLNKIDKIGRDMRSLMQPFADAQAALMRAQAQQGRPLSRQNYTEEQRKDTYKKILEKIEEEEGGEE